MKNDEGFVEPNKRVLRYNLRNLAMTLNWLLTFLQIADT
mgnify:CR=1 FL=1